ncbi:hypothetical protein IVG45_18905 [Methylomonas sp. LL1]|uniref:hypothetical protein n=1 Tax=Methylomonas sp. LL1 TaxID=2785785 RepID=UPI0018C36F40|nr:hypothetical protein [Methylomonas sp. LL1]QPK62871.1 hypothetical protein IVG45_18905 [Methylomonas sp. LL1]
MNTATNQSAVPANAWQVNITLDDIIPSGDVPKKYPHLYTEKSWKWAVLQRKHNGLSMAFRKIGKTLFVNTRVLAECIDSQIDT